ncbi:site-specific integrase [Maridesulfovibrio sp.]|uniref:tyrosine-type recombinase/integrase n=1 Tax=Maridesulfovibrio sp. TaxID=2795000 RepID=UPI002AA65927|nr:site-specific integrase [Maridesulfovibrio sp.]
MPVKRKGKWYGRVSWSGSRKEKQFPTKKDAIAWEVAMRSKISSPQEDGTRLHVLLDDYLESCSNRGQTKKHIDDKERAYLSFLELTGSGMQLVTELKYTTVQRYLNHVARKVSPHRANVHRKFLVAAWNWGMRPFGLPKENPFAVETYRVDKTSKYIPPVDDFWRLVDAVQAHEARLLMTFLYTGGRRTEILTLKWADVDFKKKVIWLQTRKRRGGGMHRDALPMISDLVEVLKEQRMETGFKEFVFISPKTKKPYSPLTKVMNKWCEKAGITPFNFHAIRHLSASILADKGYSLPNIQKLLRHQAVTTTARYLHSLGLTDLDLEGAFDRPVKKQEVNKKVSKNEKRGLG